MQKPLIIIKFGGSVITYKDNSVPKLNIKTINRLFKEIKDIIKKSDYQIILIHGAGSFGHPLASKFHLQDGDLDKNKLFGFCATTAKMIELNSLIINSLLKNKLPTISLPPHAFIKQKNKQLINFDYHLIKNYLDQGFIPVLFGDVVLDEKQGCSIISGDALTAYLAKKLRAKKIIFLSDVNGIFDKNPKKFSDAKIIPKVTNKNIKEVLNGLTVNNPQDVTGEMYGKIVEIQKNLKNIPVFIINGNESESLKLALYKDQGGTRLLFH